MSPRNDEKDETDSRSASSPASRLSSGNSSGGGGGGGSSSSSSLGTNLQVAIRIRPPTGRELLVTIGAGEALLPSQSPKADRKPSGGTVPVAAAAAGAGAAPAAAAGASASGGATHGRGKSGTAKPSATATSPGGSANATTGGGSIGRARSAGSIGAAAAAIGVATTTMTAATNGSSKKGAKSGLAPPVSPGGGGGSASGICLSVLSETELEITGGEGTPNSSAGIAKRDDKKKFTFDIVLPLTATQQDCFERVARKIVDKVLQGYNGCLFCYGQTGAGKTWTMYGNEQNPGITAQTMEYVEGWMKQREQEMNVSLAVTLLEIYNEKLVDLLVPLQTKQQEREDLIIHEDPIRGIYVQNLSERFVSTTREVSAIIDEGNERRTVGETAMNAMSSRSHSVLSISVRTQPKDDKDGIRIKESRMHLIDLAGSERADSTGATGQRLKEGAQINQSLSALGNVMKMLVEGQKHIPYRDSKLTRLLQPALGGNSLTLMIANLSPATINHAETLNTIRFAARAKHIKNKPTIFSDPKTKRIAELEAEVNRLRSELQLVMSATKVLNNAPVVATVVAPEQVVVVVVPPQPEPVVPPVVPEPVPEPVSPAPAPEPPAPAPTPPIAPLEIAPPAKRPKSQKPETGCCVIQ